jgi:hypothetical protein
MEMKPIVMQGHGELRIVYPSGKTLFFKADGQAQNDYRYFLDAEENLRANGYKKLNVEVSN